MYRKLKAPKKIIGFSLLGDLEGCGTIRVIFPSLLASHYSKIASTKDGKKGLIKYEGYYSSYFISDPKFYLPIYWVQFQRAYTQAHLDIISYFRKNIRNQTHTPILLEVDDYLLKIERWNFAEQFYRNAFTTFSEIMKNVDGMIVSTNKLKEVYSKYCKKIKVIKNHLPKFIWGEPEYKIKTNKKIRILYHGSMNHFATRDLIDKGISGGDFGNVLIDFIRKTADEYQWVFMGAYPSELELIKDKLEIHPWVNIFQFPTILKSLNADIAIASLQQNLFNECKSNIKMLEYCAAGVPAVYTNIEPYKNAKLTANSDEEMIELIKKLASDKDLQKEVWETDIKTIRSQLFWEEYNNIEKYINTYLRMFGVELP